MTLSPFGRIGLPARFMCAGFSLLATGVAAQESGCSAEAPAQPPLGADYREHAGKTIAAIRFRTEDVFDVADPRENNRLYRFMNWLHINTRPAVIAPQLLFRPGEPLQADRVAESERLLRTRPYLGNAYVQVDEVCGDQVALLVVTRDIWTLEPQISLSREGGQSQHGFGFNEDNLLGTGMALTLGYDKDEERSRTSINFYSPHLFSTRIETNLGFAETSDGQQTMVEVQQPFFSLDTPWAAGTTNWDITQDETINYKDQDINEFTHSAEFHEVFAGWAFDRQKEFAKRLSIGVTQDREEFSANEDTLLSLPLNENLVYGWLGYEYLENRFAIYRNLNLLHQTEDIAMGKNFTARLGHGGSLLGNDQEFVVYEANFTDMLGVGNHHLLHFSGSVEGRNYTADQMPDERVWGADLGYHYLVGDSHRSYAQLSYYQGHQLAQHRELTVGGSADLRGYPVDYQRGDRRYLLRLEQRYISDVHLFNLLRLGGVIYVDFGRAWGAGYPSATHLSNVGVGLRLGSSKAKVGKVLHLDLAFPLADKQHVNEFQWVMTASSQL